MLPQWFAEYTLYLGLAGIVFCVAVIAFGYAGASTNHVTELLSDMSQTRRPSAALAVRLYLEAEPEFARTKLAKPPRRRRALVGGLRWAATTYGWSSRVFREIIDTLQAAEVLSVDEAEWMKIVGPTALQEKLVRPWRKHVRAEQRRDQARARSASSIPRVSSPRPRGQEK